MSKDLNPSVPVGIEMTEEELLAVLAAGDEDVGPACVNVDVPATLNDTEEFREPYVQGYRHALHAVRKALRPKTLAEQVDAYEHGVPLQIRSLAGDHVIDPQGNKWRSTSEGPGEIVFDLGANVTPTAFALVDDGQRWHEIATEGLPPADTKVLVWIPDTDDRVGRQFQFGMLSEREGQVVWCDTDYDADPFDEPMPTHWHPLPPAPPAKEPR